MNAESMPLKHDHQQYADHIAAADAAKKGYGPIIVAMCLVLLLGLSLYAGGPYDGDSLRRYSDNIVDGTATPAVQDTCWEKGIFCVASPFDCADPLVSGCEPSTREGRECPGCCNGWSRYYSLWLATCN